MDLSKPGEEVPLAGGNVTEAVWVGEAARRVSGPWIAAVRTVSLRATKKRCESGSSEPTSAPNS